MYNVSGSVVGSTGNTSVNKTDEAPASSSRAYILEERDRQKTNNYKILKMGNFNWLILGFGKSLWTGFGGPESMGS